MNRRLVAAEMIRANIAAPIHEKLAFSEAEVAKFLCELKKELEEVFIISSFDRFTVYGVGNDIKPLINFFSENFNVTASIHYFTNSENTIHHLFAMASGLSAQEKGDQEILNVLNDAYRLALDNQCIGVVMDNLLREAISVGKQVRAESGIDNFCASITDAGLSLLGDRVTDLYHRSFLIIGTGKMARLSLDWLYHEGITNVLLATYDIQGAMELSDKYGVQLVNIQQLNNHFQQADVVIADSPGRIPLTEWSDHFPTGSGTVTSQVVLDFGTPSGFDRYIRDVPGIEFYDIDDLKSMMPPPEKDAGGLEKAWEIVLKEAHEFLLLFHQLTKISGAHSYWSEVFRLKDQELSWVFPKLGNVSERDKELIKKNTSRLTRPVEDPLKNIAIIVDRSPDDVMEILMRYYDISLNLSVN